MGGRLCVGCRDNSSRSWVTASLRGLGTSTPSAPESPSTPRLSWGSISPQGERQGSLPVNYHSGTDDWWESWTTLCQKNKEKKNLKAFKCFAALVNIRKPQWSLKLLLLGCGGKTNLLVCGWLLIDFKWARNVAQSLMYPLVSHCWDPRYILL